jgi:hypothetical protein
MDWRITDPEHLLQAVRIALRQGGEYLVRRMAPDGPILRERCVSYIHKVSWGMWSAGVDHAVISRLLDWALSEALRDNGDFFFPEEPSEYKDYQRAYRPLNFCRVAVWLDHPLVHEPRVLQRLLQYQHDLSGGCFAYIGEDPDNPQPAPTIGVLNTAFMGFLTADLELRDRARAAGDWFLRWIEANRASMSEGRVYTQVTPEGQLITEVPPGERITKIVDTQHPKQEFWQIGASMAYLTYLYDVMQNRWDYSETDARPYLDGALELLAFESQMPLDTYLWPSKCKVGWGAGELLRVLTKYQPEDAANLDLAYRIAERVAVFTFMDNQLPSGNWSCMHYPMDERIAEMAFSYKPLKDTVCVPTQAITGSNTIYLPPEEITGEFLGEMKAIEQGLTAWIAANLS